MRRVRNAVFISHQDKRFPAFVPLLRRALPLGDLSFQNLGSPGVQAGRFHQKGRCL